ncbi:MAG: flavodoxin family protein [Candidatus Thorarchaeota archaeon]
MEKQVMGIMGSPRRKGNTDLLIDEVLIGAKENGAKFVKVILDDLDIRPCRGCFTCSKLGKCVQDDDMNKLAAQMKESSVWVLGTPIYWWGPSAQFKAFLDRWVSIPKTVFRGKTVILASPMGGGSETYARHTIGILEDVINYLDMKLIATILAPGADSRGAVQNMTEVMTKARQAGRKVVKEI